MPDDLSKRLTPDEAKAKAVECRKMAVRALDESQRIMLNSIADTWDRIAADAKWNQ